MIESLVTWLQSVDPVLAALVALYVPPIAFCWYLGHQDSSYYDYYEGKHASDGGSFPSGHQPSRHAA